MSEQHTVQRIIFRPAAVQRYVQGHNDEHSLPGVEAPRLGWCYAAIAIAIAAAIFALLVLRDVVS